MPSVAFSGHFSARDLESLLDVRLPGLGVPERLFTGNLLVSQLRLEACDRSLCRLKRMFGMFAGCDLLTYSLPRFVEVVRPAGIVMVNNGDQNIAIADEVAVMCTAPHLW